MCDKVQTALDMVKERKSLQKGEIVMVFQKVAEDLRSQGERMTNLEKEVSLIKEEMRAGFADIKKLIEDEIRKKKTFWEKIPLLKEVPTWFWIILWTALIIFGGLMGVNPEFIKYIKTGG